MKATEAHLVGSIRLALEKLVVAFQIGDNSEEEVPVHSKSKNGKARISMSSWEPGAGKEVLLVVPSTKRGMVK